MAKPHRLAWFSPFPPVRTGIAGRSAELVDGLRARGYIVHEYPEARAHDFPWRRRLEPYDLPVYQFGNASHHDYEWAYALQYPGLTVLHDTHLHHARAAFLLRERRADDYRAELGWSEPDVSPDAAEIAIAGFDSRLYYEWPMVRALVLASRLTAVHGQGALRDLADALTRNQPPAFAEASAGKPPPNLQPPTSNLQWIRLGEGELVSAEREARARRDVRAKYGIAHDAVLFGCFGGLTPEKRIRQILDAMQTLRPHAPTARLIFAGAPAAHYDVAADIAARSLSDRVIVTGYLASDEELTDHLAACDVSLNLRWPTARETSGPWLRALAAGRPTVITDLAHMSDVASLDPRTWTARGGGQANSPGAVCVAIDILDEDHSLRLAMRRLATDAALRERLGRAAREYWIREHSVEGMLDDYERVIAAAIARPEPAGDLPAHMRNPGDRRLRALLRPFENARGRPFEWA